MNDPKGGWQDGDAVVRIRTDLNLPNPALRDWPALRIQTTPHPKVGDTYRVWPLLDYQSAIEDHLQGVTHIVRGKDLMDSTRKQTLLYEMRGWTYPHTLYWGRVKVHEFGSFSTSAMRTDIEAGTYSGWDDPRLPTIAAFRSKGYAPEAIRSFWLEQGLTQKDIAVSMKTIESHNVKAIESSTPRYSFVQDPVSRRLEMNETWPSNGFNIPSHPDNASMGHRQWPAPKDGDLILLQASDLSASLRLKEFANVTVSEDAARVEDFDRSDRRQIIHWVLKHHSRDAALLTVEDNQIRRHLGRLEDVSLEVGKVVQLERVGFAIVTEIQDDGTTVFTHLHD
jgi:glutamyl-tRNA synthetase